MMARLGDICEILDSKRIPITASNRQAGIYPYYGANGIQDYVDDYIFDDELVLLAEDGGHFGSTDKPIAYRVSGKCWVNNHAHVLKPNSGLDVDYLCYSLMFRDVSNIVNGATRQKLTQADMREIEIPLLPLGEQLAIVEKLNKIFALIFLRKQQLLKLDELVKSRFIELFGNSNYPCEPLDNNVIEMFIGPFGSSLKNEFFVDEEDGFCMVYEQKHAIQKTMDVPTRYVPKSKYEELKRFTVLGGDIIVSCRGTIGEIYTVPDDAPMGIMHPSIMKIRLKTEKYNQRFFVFALKQYMDEHSAEAKGSGVKMAVSATVLGQSDFVMPPLEVQNQFAAFVEQVDKSKLAIQKSLEKLETLKKALMQKYLG